MPVYDLVGLSDSESYAYWIRFREILICLLCMCSCSKREVNLKVLKVPEIEQKVGSCLDPDLSTVSL
jgi:hypothetical protein